MRAWDDAKIPVVFPALDTESGIHISEMRGGRSFGKMRLKIGERQAFLGEKFSW